MGLDPPRHLENVQKVAAFFLEDVLPNNKRKYDDEAYSGGGPRVVITPLQVFYFNSPNLVIWLYEAPKQMKPQNRSCPHTLFLETCYVCQPHCFAEIFPKILLKSVSRRTRLLN